MREFWKNQKSSYFIGLFLATILIFTSYSFFSFIFLLWVLSLYLPNISKSKLDKTLWVYAFFSVGLIAAYCLAWFIGISIKPILFLIFLDILAIFLVQTKKIITEKSKALNIFSWRSIIVAILISLYVALPVLIHPNAENVLRQASKTQDDINHAAMIEADRSINGFLFTSIKNSEKFINTGMNTYPQGYHINGAFFESQLIKLLGKDNLKNRVISFYLYKILWLGIATFFICELLFSVSDFFFGASKNNAKDLMLALAGLSLSGYLLVSLFGYGFQSFIGVLAYMASGIIILIKYFESKQNKNIYLLLLTAFGMAVALTWILPAPLILLPVVYLAIKDLNLSKIFRKDNLGVLSSNLGVFVLLIMSLTPVYLQFHFVNKAIVAIDSGGAVPPIYWISTAAIWTIFYILSKISGLTKKYRHFFIVLGIFPLEFMSFALYQQIRFGHQFYYSIKITFLASLIVLILIIPILIKLALKRFSSIKLTLICSLFLIVVLPLLLGLNIRKSLYPLKGKSPIGYNAARAALNCSENDKYIVILTKKPEESYLSTKTCADFWVYGNNIEKQTISKLNEGVDFQSTWKQINTPGWLDKNIRIIRP